MHVTRREIKTESRGLLSTKKKPAFIVTLVASFLPSLVGASGLGPLLLDGPFAAGLSQFFLRLVRREEPGVGTMFSGFGKFLRNIRLWLLQVLYVVGSTLLLVVPGVRAALRYSMVWFVVADEPDLNAREALARSKALTQGRLGDLFVLALSFFWWILFGVVTLGVGFLYVVPYIQTTWALMYEGMRAAEGRSNGSAPERPRLTE